MFAIIVPPPESNRLEWKIPVFFYFWGRFSAQIMGQLLGKDVCIYVSGPDFGTVFEVHFLGQARKKKSIFLQVLFRSVPPGDRTGISHSSPWHDARGR